jgi:hypothetical protein
MDELTKIVIELLNERLDSLDIVRDDKSFGEWKTRTLGTLAHVFGDNHIHYKALKSIKAFNYTNVTHLAIGKAREFLIGLIENLKKFGMPISNGNINTGISLQINQENNQSQSSSVIINIDLILESLKYGLSGSQIEELKEILESNQESKEKKRTFVEKIKSFGSDVASNILANLLTNPQVYEQLGGMI